MKRSLPIIQITPKMMKKQKIDFDVTSPAISPSSNTQISYSLNRNFGYKLSDKKAKSNLLDSAAREPFEIFERQQCSMLFFSVGSYLEAVFPSVLDWKNGDRNFETQNLTINIIDVLPGYDKDGKHIDTVVTFKVNGQKIVTTCYNTTQKIKVEGKGYLEFVDKYLKTLFVNILNNVGESKIDDYNKRVIAALSGKRKAVSRPMRSVKYKAMASLACNKCELKFVNNSQLSLHKVTDHTIGPTNETINISTIPIIDDISLLDISATHKEIPVLEEECVTNDAAQNLLIKEQNDEEHSIACEICTLNYKSSGDLHTHMDAEHKAITTAPLQVVGNCDFNTNTMDSLNEHNATVHIEKDSSSLKAADEVYICGECSQKFDLYDECQKHMESHPFRCYKCKFQSNTEHEVKLHEKAQHDNSNCKDDCPDKDTNKQTDENTSNDDMHAEYFECTKCEKTFKSEDAAKEHMCNIKCDQCDYKADDIASIVTHTRIIHSVSLKCSVCDYTGNDYGDLAKHSTAHHEDTSLINTMFDNVKEGLEQIELLKNMMLQVIKGQNEMKQELFVIRNDQRTVPILQCTKDTSKNKSYAEVASAAASNSIPNIFPKVPQPQQIPGHQGNFQMPLQDQQESYSSPKAFPASAKQCQDSSKILFVGDSISGNINIKKIENATGREIVCKKAYSAIHDTKENVAKKAAIFSCI